MSGELGTAFVRVRPNMTGFKEGVTLGAREAAREAAKAVALTFGVTEGIRFITEITGHAADVQKQTNLIRDEFKGAAEEVLNFAEKGAAALGISAHTAETTAGRFGILFKNLGVGPALAARMTIGFEQLAGSLSAIRGVDPALVLKNLPLAVAGNLRSLKQLGIATDQNQLKIAAFKLGLTQTVTQALTPAQRAIAIYAVATKNLGDYQAQAAKHSKDLAQVDLRLRAEWDNAKDTLGRGLIPAAAALANLFSATLPTAVDITRTVFGDLKDDVSGLVGFVAPAFRPLTHEIDKLKDVVKKGGISSGIDQIKQDFSQLSDAGKGAVIVVGALAGAFALMVAAAFPLTATVLAIVGLGVAFREAYQHSARFRESVKQVGDFVNQKVVPAVKNLASEVAPVFGVIAQFVRHSIIPAFEELRAKSGPVFHQLAATAKAGFEAIKAVAVPIIGLIVVTWREFGGTITRVAKIAIDTTLGVIKGGLREIQGVFELVTGIFTLDWKKAWKGLKDIAGGELDAVKAAVVGWGKALVAIFDGIWTSIKLSTLEGVAAFTGLLAKVPTSFKVLGKKVGFDNPFEGITEGLHDEIASIKQGRLDKQIEEATAAVRKKFAEVKTTDPIGLASAASESSKKVADSLHKAAADGLTKGVRDGVKAGADAGVEKAKSQIADLRTRLGEANKKLVSDLAQSVQEAKANLVSIGDSLATTIGQVIDEPFNIAAQRIQDAQDKLALVFDKKNAKLSSAQAQLSILQAKLNLQDAALQRQQARFGLQADIKSLKQLRDSVLLPGGKLLSANTSKAIKQLEDLAKKNPLNAPSINEFIKKFEQGDIQVKQDRLGITQGQVQHKSDLLSISEQILAAIRSAKEAPLQIESEALRVRQDAADKLKKQITRQVHDLVEGITKGGNFNAIVNGITSLLSKHDVTFKRSGKLLGTAFESGFRSQVSGLLEQAKAITQVPHQKGSGTDVTIVRPLTTLQKDTAAVHKLTKQIGEKQVGLQQKQLKVQQKMSQTLDKINSVQLGPSSNGLGRNPGKQSKRTKDLRGTSG